MKSVFAPAAILFGLTGPLAAEELQATARISRLDGQPVGIVTLTQMPGTVVIRIKASGLTPGAHGFHIHETAACSSDFKAAGGHYNPDGHGHGFAGQGAHAGDLPNLVAHEDGSARAEFLTDRISLKDGVHGSLFDTDGSAIVIHARPDSYGDSAGAGGRVACGVIERKS